MGFELCATEETALSLTEAGLEVTHLHWPESGLQPNIDELIRTGVTLSSYYTFRLCSPTRASLMSGRCKFCTAASCDEAFV